MIMNNVKRKKQIKQKDPVNKKLETYLLSQESNICDNYRPNLVLKQITVTRSRLWHIQPDLQVFRARMRKIAFNNNVISATADRRREFTIETIKYNTWSCNHTHFVLS